MKKQNEITFSEQDVCGAWEKIKSANKIVLLTHKRPDGDGIASCAALERVLLKLGKTVETIYPDKPELNFKRQPKVVCIATHSFVPDLLIALDTANYERMYYPDDFKSIALINIDHHMSNSINGIYNFVDADAASASEVLMVLLKKWDTALIDKSVAEFLLTGILYDSRIFRTQSTNAKTLYCAAELVDYGADLFALKCELLAHQDSTVIKLWALLLDRIAFSKNKNAVWSYITQADLKKMGLALSSLLGFNDFLSDISDVDVTILFYEMESGETKVSLRSKEFDVNNLAAQFGGGGHKNASGILSKEPLQELMKKVTAEF